MLKSSLKKLLLRSVSAHWGQDKMTAIFFLHMTFFKYIYWKENVCILIQMSLKFVFKGLIDNKSSLVEVMAYCLTDNRSLPEPMLTTMSDALFICLWHHLTTMSYSETLFHCTSQELCLWLFFVVFFVVFVFISIQFQFYFSSIQFHSVQMRQAKF